MTAKKSSFSYRNLLYALLVLVALVYIFSPLAYTKIRSGVHQNISSMPGNMMGVSYGERGFAIAEDVAMAPMPPMFSPGYLGDVDSTQERRVVKTGSLSILVAKITDTLDSVRTSTLSYGGFIENTSVYESIAGARQAVATVRLPSDNFEVALEEFKALAVKIDREDVQASDVSEQYVDLEVRLENARREEDQYRDILEDATDIEEILMVTQYLSQARMRVEQLEGQLNYLSRQVSMSTISLTLREEVAPGQVSSEWRPTAIVKSAFTALLAGLVSLANVIIAAVIWLPLAALWIALAVLIGWLIAKLWKWGTMKARGK
ncbi:MAG: hypothetical protein COV10_01750 [Candidatus Vogelbacteria bacterium CG10_big_fil_rev_8_21_14_0_10_51_16]|uniref:DUF4349 domain-containing protein n=1 Tax=Candidatus Vogelbacteria bacterium CG10_big_fil_rev_8_21_14_0_10_51_16 TaxID=1975045 RepID=A0A2H0REX0_9BACT|nr:MAG: hypothetical protein COV10_01750 [Candidatus Vogelbacteria bacterium CG10_big_fil_rev_8_21_14_0_10_51_16]